MEYLFKQIKNNSTSTYFKPIGIENLIQSTIYFAVRHCIEGLGLMTEINFYFLMIKWKTDPNFRMIVWLLPYFLIIYNHNLEPTTGFHLQN